MDKRLRGQNVYIRPPRYEEIDYINKLWSDINTTGEIGGPFYLSNEKAEVWFPKMVNPIDKKNYYCLVFNNNHQPVGEVSFHRYDCKRKAAEINVKIEGIHRGNGYSKEAVYLLLKYFFDDFGGEAIYDNVLNKNRSGQKALLSFGFELVSMDDDVSLFIMTKETFKKLQAI